VNRPAECFFRDELLVSATELDQIRGQLLGVDAVTYTLVFSLKLEPREGQSGKKSLDL
jgi:hypothetical protein